MSAKNQTEKEKEMIRFYRLVDMYGLLPKVQKMIQDEIDKKVDSKISDAKEKTGNT